MSDNPNSTFRFYHYDPSAAAAGIFVALFLLTTILHTYQLIRTRACFLVPVVTGGAFEAIGYVGRALSSQQTPDWTLGPYIMQSILILVAPALFAATIYMMLSRIAVALDAADRCRISPRRLTLLFVTGDVTAFFIVGGGGGIMARDADSAKAGAWIILGGLVLQLVFFGLFIAVTVAFDLAVRSRPTARSGDSAVNWRKFVWVLYGTSSLVMLRNVVRVVEYAQGNDGWLLSHEWVLYVFDAVPMLAVMIVLNVWHPSEIKAFTGAGRFMHNGFALCTLSPKGMPV